jgi:hypothetical protein
MGFGPDHCAARLAWGRIQHPPQHAQAKKERKKKEKESFALGTLNLFIKPFKPFHYFFGLWYLCIWNPVICF